MATTANCGLGSVTLGQPTWPACRPPRWSGSLARHRCRLRPVGAEAAPPRGCAATRRISRYRPRRWPWLPAEDWQTITWRDGSNTPLTSRFARWRVRPAHDDARRSEPAPEEWLLIEWPEDEAQHDHH